MVQLTMILYLKEEDEESTLAPVVHNPPAAATPLPTSKHIIWVIGMYHWYGPKVCTIGMDHRYVP